MLNLSVKGGGSVSVTGNVLTIQSTVPGEQPATVKLPTDRQAELMARVMAGQLGMGSSNSTFAMSIANNRKTTDRVMHYVDEMLAKARANEAKASAPVQTAPTLVISKITELFENARQALKRPKITLVLDTSNPTHLVRLSYDMKRGVIWLNSESFGQNYGLIDLTSGVIKLKAYGITNKTQLMALLTEFSKDPITLAITHGKLTGNCMFCQLKLSDERSLNHGYGKRCARNYRLPWGDRPNLSAVTHWSLGDK